MATLLRVLVAGGGVGLNRLPQASVALGATLARFPFTVGEQLYVAWRRRRMPPMAPPIFIVGHWRSGTTHLYNIMSRADFGYVTPMAAGLPWDFLGLASLLRPLLERTLPKDRFIDKIPVNPDSPQEDEVGIANMSILSFYHGLYFPKHFDSFFNRGVFLDNCSDEELRQWQRVLRLLLDKLSIYHRGKRILLKNPVYSARIEMLNVMYPEAKFIHIYRDPVEVFRSMRNFYARLFEAFALQAYDQVDVDQVILRTYPRMMDKLFEDAAELPPQRFVELSYEALVDDPLQAIAHIYEKLDLDGFERAQPAFSRYLETVSTYTTNRYPANGDVRALVHEHWQSYLNRFGYTLPSNNIEDPEDIAHQGSERLRESSE